MSALGALGVGTLMRPGAARADVTEIVLCNWGGAAVDAFQKAFGVPFTAKTGIKLSIDGAGPAIGAIRAMVEAKKVIRDVTDSGIGDSLTLGKGGYVEPIDYSIVDKTKVAPGFAVEHGIANYVYSNVLAFDSSKMTGAKPTSWADFFDFEKFPGKRTMCKWIQGQLEGVLLADGVEPDKMYPLDVDRAFKKLQPHLDNIIFWESGAQSQQLFRDGEVVMGNIWHTRANLLKRESHGTFDWTWNQNLLFASAWCVPKGNPAGKKVFDFINSSLDPEGQISLLRAMGNGPTNPKALELMTAEDKAVYALAPENSKSQLKIDAAYYTDREADLQNKFLDLISAH
jgi:putative spermidine/putrescine transport system substrate-binding protein